MSADETWGILGRRCVGVARLKHQVAGESLTPGCVLEILWHTGEVTVLDENTDLTLSVSSAPWRDPYADCDEAQRQRLATEVGLWSRQKPVPGDPLALILGETAVGVEPIFNRVMELAGINIRFDSVALNVTVAVGGLLEVMVSPQ